jgi:hypothetical protein
MAELVDDYLAEHPEPGAFEFLRTSYRELWDAHGGISGVVVPRPKLLPVGVASRQAAARNCAEEE